MLLFIFGAADSFFIRLSLFIGIKLSWDQSTKNQNAEAVDRVQTVIRIFLRAT